MVITLILSLVLAFFASVCYREIMTRCDCLPSFEMLLNCLENDEQSGDNEEQLWKASSQQRMSARQLRR